MVKKSENSFVLGLPKYRTVLLTEVVQVTYPMGAFYTPGTTRDIPSSSSMSAPKRQRTGSESEATLKSQGRDG